ncbi:hypothetical protein NFI96_010421 [Prochilodus magdalenae]|nr:hypothetical protein NFI96_010421 [Prochilodus magdalenae]
MAKTKELSKDTRDKPGKDYGAIAKQLGEKRSTVGAIIRKWKKLNMTVNLPRTGAPRKISLPANAGISPRDRGVNMGGISSAQRDSKQDTVTESSAGQDGAQEDSAEEKLLQKNGQISSLSEKTESQADESNSPYEQRVLAEVGSGFVTLKEDDTETTEDLQEGDTSQTTEESAQELINADGVTVEKDDEVEKQNDIEVGFKRIFRFVGFKFTLKKDKCDKTDTEEPTINNQDKNAAVCAEDSRDTSEASPVSTNEQDTDEMQKDLTSGDVQVDSEQVSTAPETDNETAVSQTSEITEDNEKITPDKEQIKEVAQSPEPEEPMSPFKRFFTQGIFASLRKKRKEEEAPKENKEVELKRTDKEEGEKMGEARNDSTCVCLNISNITPEEGGDLQTENRDQSTPAAQGELISSQEQDKVPASPLKRLFRKLSTRRQRETQPAETSLIEPGEKLNETPQSSTELNKVTKEEEEAKVEEPKPAEEEQITDISPEEPKKKSDSTVSWESLICIGSTKKRARKTSDSEDAMQDKGEEAKNTAESPLGSSTEGGYDQLTSSNEQTGSPAEEESGSTWKSLKKLVTPKRKSRMEEAGSSEQIPSDTELTKDESSCSITKLIPGRKKRKFDGQQEQTLDEAGRGNGTDNEDDETPVIVPLSEYEIIEPESLIEITDEPELEKGTPPLTEEDKPKETAPSVKSSYDVGPLVVPIPSDYIEDLTEFISKHQQLSDIPEEGIIEESVVTPVSSAEWTTQDDTLAEDIVELTADAVTAPEPASEQFSGDETTEMVSAVSQLTESPKTSGNVTPVPPEYDLREADVIIQEVVESIFITSTSSQDKDPEALAVPVSPCCEETPLTPETKVAVAHEKAEATFICTGLVSQQMGDVKEVLSLALIERISEFTEAVSTELVSEEMTEGPELAGLATDNVYAAEEIKTELHEAFLPDKDLPPLAETDKELEEIFQTDAELMEESRVGEIVMMVQEEEVKEHPSEAINGNQELTTVQMAVLSAVQGETLLLEEQVTATDINELPEAEALLYTALYVKEPVHKEPALYTEITVEGEKEDRLPDVPFSATDVEQVALAVVETVAQTVTVAEPDSTINKASGITEDVVQVSLAEVVETIAQNVVVSEPETTLDKASELTEGAVGVFASAVERPETPEVISIVSPVSDSIKVVAVELEDKVQIKNVPSLHFSDSHEIQVEVKDTELEIPKVNVEAALDVATAENVVNIYEKVEEIRGGETVQQQTEPTEESVECFAEDIVHDIKVGKLSEIVSEPPLEETELNLVAKEGSLSSVAVDETSAVEQPQGAPEVKLDLEKEHSESNITSVEDHEPKQNTEDEVHTVTPDEADKQEENIPEVPVISKQTGLQEESAKEGLAMENSEGLQPEDQKTELVSDSHDTEAAPESVEEATAITDSKGTCADAEVMTSATTSEKEPEHQEETSTSEINLEIAKEPQEIIEVAAPSPNTPEVNTDQQQTGPVTSKPEERQVTEPSLQICTEDEQVADDIITATKTISEAAIMHVEETTSEEVSSPESNEIVQTCEVEKYTIAKPEGGEVEISEEPVATVQHLEVTSDEDKVTVPTIEAVKAEAPLTVNQEPEALVTPAIEVSEPVVVVIKDVQELSEGVSEQKEDTACVIVQEVVTAPQVEEAAASEMDTETLSVMEQKEEPTTTISEAETAVSVELVPEPPMVTENDTPEVTQPEVQTQVMNELQAEALEVTVPKVETHVVTEVKLETAVITEPEEETPVLKSVVAELEVETPVLTSVANIDLNTTDLPSMTKDTDVQPVLTVKLPAVAQGTTEGGIISQGETPAVAGALIPQLQTPGSPEKEMAAEVSKEKDTKVNTPVVVEVTEPKLELPKAEETTVQTAVSDLEAQIPAVASALDTGTLLRTCEEKNLDAQSPVVTSVKEIKEVGSTFVTSVINEPQLQTPVIPAVQTPVVVPTIQMSDTVRLPMVTAVTTDVIETKAETPVLDVNTLNIAVPEKSKIQVETAVVKVKTPAATSVVTEIEVSPVKEAAEPAIAPVTNPPTVAPEVQTLTMVETPTTIPPVEKLTVVQTPANVLVVQTLTSDTPVKEPETPVGAPDVKDRCEETLAAAEVEPPSLTEAEVTKATEQVTQSTAEPKEEPESLETINRVPSEVSTAKAPEPLPDMEDDVWEDAVDDIRVDECATAKAAV